jgi:hypothetical protein
LGGGGGKIRPDITFVHTVENNSQLIIYTHTQRERNRNLEGRVDPSRFILEIL